MRNINKWKAIILETEGRNSRRIKKIALGAIKALEEDEEFCFCLS